MANLLKTVRFTVLWGAIFEFGQEIVQNEGFQTYFLCAGMAAGLLVTIYLIEIVVLIRQWRKQSIENKKGEKDISLITDEKDLKSKK